MLATTAGAAGALALTACGSEEDDGGTEGSGETGGAGDETSESPGGDGADGGNGGDGGGDGGAAGAIAGLDEVPVGEAAGPFETPDGEQAMLFRPDETTVACFSAICTHQGCPVQPDGERFHCPCHQSVFDAATGEVLDGPAPVPLPAIPARIEGDQIVAG
ncbi:ubiquinol-cytochrome c reductase iron-sulfur subunit [Streptomyces sp. 4N509B]|uniref:ubiquinol-cytochrome c reductase iron-sulfur subunit n=1 Tax=Streptomyces sp. 4N509B TaxID=3457413 RepID=UPI003FD341F0